MTTCGTLASWFARCAALDRDRDAVPGDRGHGGRVRGAVRRADRLRVLRVGDPAPTRSAVPRGARARAHRRALGLRVLDGAHRRGRAAGLDDPAGRSSTRASTSLGGRARASVGAVVAVVFTYLVLGLRRVFRLGPRRCARSSVGSRSRCSRCWSPYALTFGEQQTAYVLQHGSRSACSSSRSSRSCSARRSRCHRGGPAASSSRCSSWARRSASSRTTVSSTRDRRRHRRVHGGGERRASRKRCSARPSSSPRWAASGCCPPRCSPSLIAMMLTSSGRPHRLPARAHPANPEPTGVSRGLRLLRRYDASAEAHR